MGRSMCWKERFKESWSSGVRSSRTLSGSTAGLILGRCRSGGDNSKDYLQFVGVR